MVGRLFFILFAFVLLILGIVECFIREAYFAVYFIITNKVKYLNMVYCFDIIERLLERIRR